MIGVMIIATGGSRYTQFVKPLMQSLKEFFPPHQVILFTDDHEDFGADVKLEIPGLGWPLATLMRYKAFSDNELLLTQYEWLFYVDTDMRVMSKIEASEICGDDITAVKHPAYGTYSLGYEKNPMSLAYIEGNPRSPEYPNETHVYYQGCVQGGKASNFLDMSQILSHNINVDLAKNYIAVRHDESHLNRYLADHPPTIALDPIFAFPQSSQAYPSVHGRAPKIVHLEKDQGWKEGK